MSVHRFGPKPKKSLASLVVDIDDATTPFFLAVPADRREACIALKAALIEFGVMGEQGTVPAVLIERALRWRAGRLRLMAARQSAREANRQYEDPQAPKSRDTRKGVTAFTEIASAQKISRYTAEKRVARHRAREKKSD